jgi:hypothetical protein
MSTPLDEDQLDGKVVRVPLLLADGRPAASVGEGVPKVDPGTPCVWLYPRVFKASTAFGSACGRCWRVPALWFPSSSIENAPPCWWAEKRAGHQIEGQRNTPVPR